MRQTNPIAYEPTEEHRRSVDKMASFGITEQQIAAVIGVPARVLRQHYSAELDTSAIRANANVAAKLYENALAGDTAAQTFWLKSRAGWPNAGKKSSDQPESPAIATDDDAMSFDQLMDTLRNTRLT